tara:strand:- start:790 stop:3738 length:2949 start_codon:yes stop_codon:yes gene_type:complete
MRYQKSFEQIRWKIDTGFRLLCGPDRDRDNSTTFDGSQRAVVRARGPQSLLRTGILVIALCLGGGMTPFPALGADANSAYEKALTSFHQRDIEATIIHLRNALKADPDHLASRLLMAEALIARGDGAAAEIELNFARSLGADADRLAVLFGESYILQNKYDKVLETIRPGNRGRLIETQIAFLRGQAYLGQRKLANADRSFARALELNPDHQNAMLGRAQVAATRKQYGAAMAYIDQALQGLTPLPNAWLMKSQIYKMQGFPREALTAINEALALATDHLAARLTRAALYVDLREYEKAEEDVDYILERIPREPRAKYLKAVIAAATGDLGESREKMDEVINTLRAVPEEIMKNNPSYYYLAGLTNFQFGNLDEAREFLQEYLKLEKNDIGARRVLGALELQAGDPMAASLVLVDAYREQPDNPTILTLLGMAYLEMGNVRKANYYFERVVSLLPTSAQGLTNLARGKMAAGSISEAIQNLIKAEQHNLDSTRIKLLLAQAYQKAGDHKKAIAIVEELKKQDPDSSFLHQLHAVAVGLDGQHDLARQSFEKALELDPENISAHIHLARMDLIAGDVRKAIDRIKGQLGRHPESVVLMTELGDLFTRAGQPEEALFWYKKAYSLDGETFATLAKLAEGYAAVEELDKAIEVAQDFTIRFPEDKDVYDLLGRLYMQANDPVAAIKSYKMAVEYAINRGEALMALGAAQLRTNDRKGAASAFRKAIAWDPELREAYIALINIAIEERDRLNGLELLKSLRKITSGSPAADILEGNLYYALRDLDKAEASYKKAMTIGDNPLAVLGLFKVYRDSDRLPRAIALLEKWTEKYPQDLPLGLTLGTAYKLDGQLEKAVAHYETLLKRFPDMPAVLNNAANVQFLLGNEEKAVEYARRAQELRPEDVTILDTLAWIETRRGRPEVALPLLRKSLALEYGNPEIKYHLAVTLDKLGRRAEALRPLREALQSGQDFEGREEAEKLLAGWRQN